MKITEEMISTLDTVRYKLYKTTPFFGAALARVEILFKEPEEVPTACITYTPVGYQIWLGVDFWQDLSKNKDHLEFVLAHEIGHLLFGHIWRRGRRDPKISNIAMDFALNLILADECGFKMPPDLLYDKKWIDMPWEVIYDKLLQEQQENPKKFQTMNMGNEGNGQGTYNGQKQMDSHDSWGEQEDKNKEITEQHWKGVTAGALMQARKQGKLPAGIDRLAGKLLKQKMDWKAVLYRYIRDSEQTDESWTPPDRRQAAEDVWFPVEKMDETLRDVIVCFDTSGSVSADELGLYLTSVENILKNFQKTKGILMVGDAAVHYEGDIQKFHLKKYPGGGGTDFRPFFERANKKKQISLVIFFTDMFGTFPETAPKYPVLWCSTSGVDTAPFGTVIPIGQDL